MKDKELSIGMIADGHTGPNDEEYENLMRAADLLALARQLEKDGMMISARIARKAASDLLN